jgi:hypothetical protein
MKKIIDELINHSIKGVDVYRWKDATWLIFTNETRWVVELTDEGTLWYNYKFFKDIFKYVSITVGTEMDGYIIQWANDFFYKDCAHRSAAYPRDKGRNETPKVLEHGIKDVSRTRDTGEDYIEKIVDGGIKETQGRGKNHGDEFEWHTRAVIDNGIKEVYDSSSTHRQMRAENLVPRIIKNIKPNRVIIKGEKMDRFYYSTDCAGNNTEIFRIVEEGVKKVKPNIEYSQQSGVFHPDCVANHVKIEKVIEEGVKKIYPDMDPDVYDWSDEFKADNVIQGGIKVIPLPTIKDLRGYSDYYNTKEDRTKPHTEYVKDAIQGGTKL